MLLSKVNNIPLQRKTTLKWDGNGELSSVDMTRILQLLSDNELTECVLSCDVNNKSREILFQLKERL